MTIADGDEIASHLPTQLASSGSMDLIENEFQFLKDYDSSGFYRGLYIRSRFYSSLVTRRSCIIDVSAVAVFNEESTEEQKTDQESVSFDTGTVSVIEEEEPTDLDCSESLMTIKSYRDTQKKVTKSGSKG